MPDKRKKGFTFIELMAVISIIAILIVIATIFWSQQARNQEFRKISELFVQQIREAQAEAKAYGMDPEGYTSSGSFANGVSGDYVGIIGIKGLNKTPQVQEYKNVEINFTNFQITPMTETTFNNDYKGVALLLGFKSGGGYAFNKMLPFNPNGTPMTPTGETEPTDPYYEIEIVRKTDSGGILKKVRVQIDKTTGAVNTLQDK